MLDKRQICVDVADDRQLGRRGRMLEINENKGADSGFAFWWWIGVFVGLPLAAFAAGCWQMLCGDGAGPVFMQGVPFLIGVSMGYLVLASSCGLLRLPRAIKQVRGWCIDDLVREHDTIRAGNRKCPQDNDDPVIQNPREALLALYGKYGACTKPGYEHISTSELARLSPIDREFLSRILKAWNRQKALEVLKKATGENGNGGAR